MIEQNISPRIGTMFFVNPEEKPVEVEKHFQLMYAYGIKMVRLFLIWNHVEPLYNKWNFEHYDFAYDCAHKYGMQVVCTITCEDPPGWTRLTPFYHHRTNLNDPILREHAAIFIEKLVTRYRNHPAHYMWILMNEPTLKVNFESSTMKLFGEWLENRYRTIEQLNERWFTQYGNFSDIRIHPEAWNEYWNDYPSFVDWTEFKTQNLCMQLTWIKEEIRKYDAYSLIHANPFSINDKMIGIGQDLWEEAEVVDLLGASIHPGSGFREYTRQEFGLLYSFCVDLVRSASGEKPFWITELQAGSTIFTGSRPFTPTPEEISAWLWNSLGAGAKAVIYWMWHPRKHGQEAGEWGIVSTDHRISPRLEASAKVSHILSEYASFFEAARPEQAKVAILYNKSVDILTFLEGVPTHRKPEYAGNALLGVYRALRENDVAADFLHSQHLNPAELSKYKMIYMPFSYALERETQALLLEYVRNGGMIWADSPCGWKDKYGYLHPFSPDRLSEAFGLQVIEYRGCVDPVVTSHPSPSNSPDKFVLPYRWIADVSLEDGKTICKFADGKSAAISNCLGKGQAFFISTAASLGYYDSKADDYFYLITSFSDKLGSDYVRLAPESRKSWITTRVLINGNEAMFVVQNGMASCEAVIEANPMYTKARCIQENQVLHLVDHRLSLDMRPMETKVLLFS